MVIYFYKAFLLIILVNIVENILDHVLENFWDMAIMTKFTK